VVWEVFNVDSGACGGVEGKGGENTSGVEVGILRFVVEEDLVGSVDGLLERI